MSDSDTNPVLNKIIAEYLELTRSGKLPDRQHFIDQHPDLENDLKSFFANHDQTKEAAEAGSDAPTLSPSGQFKTLPPSSEGNEDATIPPGDSQTANASEVGTKVRYFGDYELLQEIARGGMGVVYKARQVNLNRIVALKMILAGQLAGDEDVQRFHAEAEAAANLEHPGIVPIFEVGEHEGQHYFSMGFVEGQSLADRIKDGPLPPRQAAEYTKKVAEAMAFAHERGVIHRDLKPANVLLDQNDQPKVTDFGLAKKVEGDSGLTATGQILGTPSYMPPEQASGKTNDVTESADVYSLGAILYAILTGRPPFQAANHLDTLMQVLEQETVSPCTLNPRVPKDLETICLKCLEKEAWRRYGSADELADELRRFLNSEPIRARPISTLARAWRWCKRKPVVSSLAASVVVTILIGFFGVTSQWFRAEHHAAEEKAARQELRRRLYAAEMNLVQRAWEDGNLSRMQALLDRQRPGETDQDLRNFPWYYWSRLIGRDLATFTTKHFGPIAVLPGRLVAGHTIRFRSETESSESRVDVLDIASGDIVTSLDGISGDIAGLVVSPDGQTLISAANCEDGSSLRSWDLKNGKPLESSNGAVSVSCVAMSADGRTIATGSWRDDDVTLWDGTTIERRATLSGTRGNTVLSAAFSPDDKLLATGNYSGSITLWHLETGITLAVLEGHGTLVISTRDGAGMTTPVPVALSFAPDGSVLASGGADRSLKIWDAKNGVLRMNLDAHQDVITSVVFSPDGRTLVSGSRDGVIRIWDAGTYNLKATLKGHAEKAGIYIAFDPSGRTLASRGWEAIKLWDLSKCDEQIGFAGGGFVRSASFLPNSQRLLWTSREDAGGVRSSRVRLTDVRTSETSLAFSGGDWATTSISHDGKTAALCDRRHLKLWDVDSRTKKASAEWPAASAAF